MSNKLLSLAENINTPGDRLRQLAYINESKLLAAIARNPNTPPDILIKLAGNYIDEIQKNPALDLILIECPNFLEDIYYKHFNYHLEFYKNKRLPKIFLKLGFFHPNWQIRAFIANNQNISIRTILITHPKFSKMIDRVPDLSMKDGRALDYKNKGGLQQSTNPAYLPTN